MQNLPNFVVGMPMFVLKRALVVMEIIVVWSCHIMDVTPPAEYFMQINRVLVVIARVVDVTMMLTAAIHRVA